jgi:hypothetical protein
LTFIARPGKNIREAFMPRNRFTTEQIIAKLREAEVELAQGRTVRKLDARLAKGEIERAKLGGAMSCSVVFRKGDLDSYIEKHVV